MIVLPDADIGMAADAAVSRGLRLGSGERCMAIATVVAVGEVADPLVEAIKERLPKVKVGPGTDPEAQMGPLVTRPAPRQGRLLPRQRAGAGRHASWPTAASTRSMTESDGFFLGASLIDDVTPGHGRLQGRDLRARPDGRARARRTRRPCGWSTTTRMATARPSSPATVGLRASSSSRSTSGMVGINVPIPVPVAYYSFGGWKASLFGDLHMYGPEGIQFYTRAKVVTSRWPDPATSKVDLGFPRTR